LANVASVGDAFDPVAWELSSIRSGRPSPVRSAARRPIAFTVRDDDVGLVVAVDVGGADVKRPWSARTISRPPVLRRIQPERLNARDAG
jgi:hypothetical protein